LEFTNVKQMTMRAALMAAVLIGASQPAFAQSRPWEDRVFAGVSFGFEPGTEKASQTRNFGIYGEDATIASNSSFDANAIVDLNLGVRVKKNFGIGVAYHSGKASGEADVTGSIPSPIFFDRPRSFNERVGGFERTEYATHLQFGWMLPINDALDVFVYAGPSFYRVSQDVVADVTVGEQAFPFANVVVSPVLSLAKRNATGYNIGTDVAYMLYSTDTVRVGIGGFLRVTGAQTELRAGDSTIEADLGGIQYGIGVRFRF
jgi:hypothetical protein